MLGFSIMSIIESYESAHEAFRTQRILSDSNEKLIEYLHGLSNQNNINTGTQHRDIIRGLTINHILLQRHINGLNRQNEKTQRWVIALAVAALIAAVVQTTVAIRVELREEAKTQQGTLQPPQLPQQAVMPIPQKPQTNGQAIKKTP